MKQKTLFLLDIMPLLYRAHFATMGKKFGTTTGIDTRTTLVFFNYIFQVITEEKPGAIAAALDSKPKQREEVSTIYKANREKMPSEISDAFPYAMQLMKALNIPVLKEEGYEADDIIAAMAKNGAAKDYKVFIVSPDKDFAQMVNENIFLFRPAYKGAVMETLDTEGVKNKYGVPPHQVADFLALRGDSVDNIVGVKGIGDKTAAQLLSEFESIEALVENADKIKQPKIKESIVAAKDQLRDNKQLSLLTGDVDIDIDWNSLESQKPDVNELLPLLDELQFVRIKERLEKQGFIELSKESVEQASVEMIPIVEMQTMEAASQIYVNETVAIGYAEEQEKLLFFQQSWNRIIETDVKDEESFTAVIQKLEQQGLTIVGYQLKPLLKKIIKSGIEPSTQWIDITLAAYLLEPDAKIDWAYLKDKYELPAYNVASPVNITSYLPALPIAWSKIQVKLNEMQMDNLLFNIELPIQTVVARMELYGLRIDLDACRK
jgi:DNA polymerase-1